MENDLKTSKRYQNDTNTLFYEIFSVSSRNCTNFKFSMISLKFHKLEDLKNASAVLVSMLSLEAFFLSKISQHFRGEVLLKYL